MITIIHAYPELLNLYGDYANVKLLQKRLEAAGEEVCVKTLEPGVHTDLSDADFIFFGAGTELKMLAALKDFSSYKEEFEAVLAKGTNVLCAGNSMALFVKKVTDMKYSGEYEGLGLIDAEAVIKGGRNYSEVVCSTALTDKKVYGAVNSSMEFTGACEEPFSTVIWDSTGKYKGGREGYTKGDNFFLTEMCGPVFFRNPALLDVFAQRLAGRELAPCEENWYLEMTKAYDHVADLLSEQK